MSFRNTITENLFLPLSDAITGNSVYRCLKLLNKSQYWTREEINSYQDKKLRTLIKHAYTNVPFYRELFKDLRLKPEDIQTKKDLIKIPIITKEMLKRNKNKHFATNIKSKNLLFRSSSGSTGEPFQFYQTKYSESFKHSCAIRSWQWYGYNLGDKYAKISMNERSSKIKKIQDLINNCLYLSSNQLTNEIFKKIALSIKQNNPKIIRCYPVPLTILAQQIIELFGCYEGNSLIAINTTGSTLQYKTRQFIETAFNVKIFDSYSCEGGTNFSQCSESGIYHPSEEYAISEFISDDYTLTDSEHPKRHISTDLHNYASPFIRYDTQDYLVLGEEQPCTCGRHFMNIKKIKGRDSDILITPSGKYLIVENFVAYFEWIKEVEQIQVVQNKHNQITINMVVNDIFTNETMNKLYNYWTNYIGQDVELILQKVDEIKLTPSGKRRTLIRNPEIRIP